MLIQHEIPFICKISEKVIMQRGHLRDRAQRMHALQPRALVGGAALIDYRGCGLMGG